MKSGKVRNDVDEENVVDRFIDFRTYFSGICLYLFDFLMFEEV